METTYQEKRPSCPRFLKYIGWGILGTIGIAAFGFLFGWFVMLLWNWLMPMLFGLGAITFWQAVGLVILARMLFGGLKPPFHHSKEPRDHFGRSSCSDGSRDWKKWKHYGAYWKERGEKDFDEFIKQKEEGGGAKPE